MLISINPGLLWPIKKTAEIQEEATGLIMQYQAEQKKSEDFKTEVNKQLREIHGQLLNNPSVNPETRNDIKNLQIMTQDFKMKPAEEIFKRSDLLNKAIRK